MKNKPLVKRVLLIIVCIEVGLTLLLSFLGLIVESKIVSIIGITLIFSPLLLLLRLEIKTDEISEKKRRFLTLLFWFLLLAYVSGMIGTLIPQPV